MAQSLKKIDLGSAGQFGWQSLYNIIGVQVSL